MLFVYVTSHSMTKNYNDLVGDNYARNKRTMSLRYRSI